MGVSDEALTYLAFYIWNERLLVFQMDLLKIKKVEFSRKK